MRLLWLLEEVRSRRLGFGKAAELAGLPIARFLLLMGQHRITPFDYDEDELTRELEQLPPTSFGDARDALEFAPDFVLNRRS
jgi:hypothetical protein